MIFGDKLDELCQFYQVETIPIKLSEYDEFESKKEDWIKSFLTKLVLDNKYKFKKYGFHSDSKYSSCKYSSCKYSSYKYSSYKNALLNISPDLSTINEPSLDASLLNNAKVLFQGNMSEPWSSCEYDCQAIIILENDGRFIAISCAYLDGDEFRFMSGGIYYGDTWASFYKILSPKIKMLVKIRAAYLECKENTSICACPDIDTPNVWNTMFLSDQKEKNEFNYRYNVISVLDCDGNLIH